MIASALALVLFLGPADLNGIQVSTSVDDSVRGRPCDARVFPGDDLQGVLNRFGSGTTVCFSPGLYKIKAELEPRNGQILVADQDAILSGAAELVNWTFNGKFWTHPGAKRTSTSGLCEIRPDGTRSTTCRYRDNVFLDDTLLTRVARLRRLKPGRVYLDYDQRTIYIADDPTYRRVEISRSFGAIRSALRGGIRTRAVIVEGFIVEKFANPAQFGAIHAEGGEGWLVEANEVRLNNGVGIRLNGRGHVIRGNYVHHNGQVGVGGITRHSHVTGNEIAFNNTKGFSPGWEAGGTKFAQSRYLRIQQNHVHHNYGPGLWTDGDNIHTVIEGNLVEHNTHDGIFHEISYNAIIRYNTIVANGFRGCRWMYGAGILIATSSDVEIHDNVLEDNCRGIAAIHQRRGSGAYGRYVLRRLWVHDNTIVASSESWSGIAQDVGNHSVFTRKGNRFNRNTYFVPETSEKYWAWKDAPRTWRRWRSYGNDLSGARLGLEAYPDRRSSGEIGLKLPSQDSFRVRRRS